MRNRLLNLFLISFIILYCNSESLSDSTNSKVKNQSEKSISEISTTLFVDTENSIINWTGKKLASSHEGTLNILSGEIVMNGDDILSGKIEVDMASILNTDLEDEKSKNKLTSHLKNEDFFNIKEYPTSTLILNNVEKYVNSNYSFTGDLTIKGITNSVDFTGTVENNGVRYSANIKLIFDRTLWNIKYGSGKFFENLGDKMILDDIDLNIVVITR